MDLDKIDYKLIELLQANAKSSIKALALEVGLTTTPVYERIKHLEQNGFIKRYSIDVDQYKLGLDLTIFCQVMLKAHSKNMMTSFEKAIKQMPEVMEMYHTSGEYDYLMKIICKDHHSYHDFLVNKLSDLDLVSKVQSNFVMDEVKVFTHFTF